MVPTTTLICTTPPAITLGPARAQSRLTPAVSRGQARERCMSARAEATTSTINWNTPPTVTAHDSQRPASSVPSSRRQNTKMRAAISTVLRRLGAKAAAAKRSRPLSTPE